MKKNNEYSLKKYGYKDLEHLDSNPSIDAKNQRILFKIKNDRYNFLTKKYNKEIITFVASTFTLFPLTIYCHLGYSIGNLSSKTSTAASLAALIAATTISGIKGWKTADILEEQERLQYFDAHREEFAKENINVENIYDVDFSRVRDKAKEFESEK